MGLYVICVRLARDAAGGAAAPFRGAAGIRSLRRSDEAHREHVAGVPLERSEHAAAGGVPHAEGKVDPETMRPPSGSAPTSLRRMPLERSEHAPLVASHTRRSVAPETMRLPSGEKHTEVTHRCALSGPSTHAPLVASHTRRASWLELETCARRRGEAHRCTEPQTPSSVRARRAAGGVLHAEGGRRPGDDAPAVGGEAHRVHPSV